MQNFNGLLLNRSLRIARFLPHFRNLCSQTINADDMDELQNQVLVEGKAHSRTAILNRPSALNALTTSMGARLKKLYESWEENPEIGFVVMKGSGRAFCAGGDIVTLYRLLNEGKMEDCKEFFRQVYSFIYLVGTYLKPHVAILDGITMGGGAGVSIPGTFRVATENTEVLNGFDKQPIQFHTLNDMIVMVPRRGKVLAIRERQFALPCHTYLVDCLQYVLLERIKVFATPETLIGFHPDAGASFHLSHLPGYIGEYLALTGEKLNGAEMLACGLATHYSLSARLPLIEEQLGTLVTDDPSVMESSLEHYCDLVPLDKKSAFHRIERIDKCFGHDTVEEIIDALEREATGSNNDWCTSALKKLKEASPLSLKVSLRSIREGRFQTLGQCLIREYRMSLQGISKQAPSNFSEGVRARLVDKDLAPKWDPPNLDKVSKDMVDSYFLPLSELEPDLELPTKLREAFT